MKLAKNKKNTFILMEHGNIPMLEYCMTFYVNTIIFKLYYYAIVSSYKWCSSNYKLK